MLYIYIVIYLINCLYHLHKSENYKYIENILFIIFSCQVCVYNTIRYKNGLLCYEANVLFSFIDIVIL